MKQFPRVDTKGGAGTCCVDDDDALGSRGCTESTTLDNDGGVGDVLNILFVFVIRELNIEL